jgi:hypothetical protein
LITLDMVFMREAVLRGLIKREESEVKKTQSHHGFYWSVEIKLTVCIPHRNTRARTHTHTHTHTQARAQNVTSSYVTDQRETAAQILRDWEKEESRDRIANWKICKYRSSWL